MLSLWSAVRSAHLLATRYGAFAQHGWPNPFDTGIERYLGRFVVQSPRFDLLASIIAEHNLFKGAPIIFLWWTAFFFKDCSEQDRNEARRRLVAIVPAALVAVFLSRILARVLPFRARPFAVLHEQLPRGVSMGSLLGWSSFPSDHACLFIAIALGIWFANRRIGWIALVYTACFICFPRIYLGIHWPTDILAGAALGAIIAAVVLVPGYRNFLWRWMDKSWEVAPGISAALMFLLSYEITDLFAGPIAIALRLWKQWHS